MYQDRALQIGGTADWITRGCSHQGFSIDIPERSRGFENPLPRTESPGLAQFDESPGLTNSEFFLKGTAFRPYVNVFK
jgi:hypothetical protein